MDNRKIYWGVGLAAFLILIYWMDLFFAYKWILAIVAVPICLVQMEVIPWELNNQSAFALVLQILPIPIVLLSLFAIFVMPRYTTGGIIGLLIVGFDIYLLIKMKRDIARMEREIDEETRAEKEKEYGTAVFQPVEIFKNMWGDDNKTGLYIGYNILRKKHFHCVTVAPPGSGKGACLIVPNLLKSPFGSYVVTDPKGENACITARAQKEYGQKVYILDPWGLQKEVGATHEIPTATFNPFDFIRKDKETWPDNCSMIANILCPDRLEAKEPFWHQAARSIIRLCLVHILTTKPTDEQNFWTLYKMLRQSEADFINLLKAMRLNTEYDGLISAWAEEYIGLIQTTDTFNGVISNARAATAIFESPSLRKSLATSTFDPYELPNGNVTLYINIPDTYIKSHSEYLKIILALCFKAVNAKPNKRVNFLIDEAGYIGNMDDINDSGFTFGRGQEISVWCFYQTIGMIEKIYGQEGAHDLLGKARIQQYFGLTDLKSTQYLSNLLGNKTRVRFNEPTTDGQKGTYEAYDYTLMSHDELSTDPFMIVFENGRKAKLPRVAYFSDKFPEEWRERADPPPMINRAKPVA